MALASFAVVALRQLAGRPGAPAESLPATAVHAAVRRAWLALEIGLAGTPVHECLAGFLSRGRGIVFREQIEVLRDLLERAGLEVDPDGCRDCAKELRSARRERLPFAGLAAPVCGEGPSGNGSMQSADEDPSQTLAGIARDMENAGYPNLAGLLELRSLWDEPLFLGVVEYFLRRSLHDLPEANLPDAEESDDSWRCLEMLADLLEQREEEIVGLLDRTEEVAETATDEGSFGQAVAALYQMGLSCSRRGDHRKAATHFTAALKLDPTNALLYHQRGEANRLLCKYQLAIADFQAAVRLSPQSPAILASRALAYHLSGEHARAIADCNAALALDPDNADAYRTRARATVEPGSHAQALADLTRVIALAPEDDEAPYLRGLIHARQQDFAAAVADFNRALELNPNHVPAWLHRGHAHHRLRDYPQAIRDYSEVLRLHPGNGAAYSGRGLSHKFKGDADRAIADFTEAIKLESASAHDYYQRGTLYRARGDLANAQADLDDAIHRQPEFWPALYCRGKMLFAQGQYSLAVLDLTEVVRITPTFVAGYLSRALAHDRLGNHRAGITDGDSAIALDANSPAAYLVRGMIHAHQKDRAAALADLTAAIRLDERFALAYHERSMTHTLQGDYDLALADCHQFIALEPGSAQAYATRSIVYHFKGDVAQALTDYSRALQIEPQRMMSFWNEPVTENARSRVTQRIADSIDGLRQETSAAEPSLSAFQIVVRPSDAGNDTVADQPARVVRRKPVNRKKPAEQPSSTRETLALAVQPDTTLPDLPVPPKPETEEIAPDSTSETVEPLLPITLDIGLMPTEEPQPESPVGIEVEDPAADPVEPAFPVATEDVPPEMPQPRKKRRTEIAPPKPRKEKVEWEEPASAPIVQVPTLATCRNCSRQTMPQPTGDGRGRCEHCKSVFPLAAFTQGPSRKKEAKEPFLETWRKPLTVLAGIAAVLIVMLVLGPQLFGNGRLRVYRAHGKADFEGKPMANATVFLHPVGMKGVHFPRPCATVKEDGTFALGTYGKGDGAPAGEYKVTVEWVVPLSNSPVPVNVLPAKYAAAATSDLTVRIKSGENVLPPIQFTREGKK